MKSISPNIFKYKPLRSLKISRRFIEIDEQIGGTMKDILD